MRNNFKLNKKPNKHKLSISFEFFPPKTEDAYRQLSQTSLSLAKYNPEFFSVTCGAGGSTCDGTLKTVQALQKTISANDIDVPIAPHVSCISMSCENILQTLHEYKNQGIKHIVALRGDIPNGQAIPHASAESSQEEKNRLKFANELVQLIRQEFNDYFFVDVAAYPEFHPQCKSPTDDILHLKRKCDAGANRAITQYFYNPDAYFYFREQCIKHHINIPIIPGIMPITNYASLARFSNICGAEIPCWIRKRLEAMHDDFEQQSSFGLEVVYRLCENLIASEAPGLHFYTLNKSKATIAILNELGLQKTLDEVMQFAANVSH